MYMYVYVCAYYSIMVFDIYFLNLNRDTHINISMNTSLIVNKSFLIFFTLFSRWRVRQMT